MKNFKIIVLSFLVIAVSLSSYSQKDEKGKKKSKNSKMVIRFGSQTANFKANGSALDGFSSLNGFYFGVAKFVKPLPIPFVRIGTGLEFFQTGTVASNKNAVHLSYLSVPLNLRLKFGSIYFLGGVSPSLKVSDKWEILGEKITPEDDYKAKSFDIPVYAGMGFKILMFSIEARYHWGTMQLYDDPKYSDLRNRYFQLGLGLSF